MQKITSQRCVSNYRRWMTGFHPPCSLPADNQFRMSILERLEQMERRMVEMARDNQQQQQRQNQQQHGSQLATPPPPPPEDHEQSSQWFERRIVGVCERMMRGGRWSGGGGERLHHSVRHRGMTLLHLAAAQGYTHLIHTVAMVTIPTPQVDMATLAEQIIEATPERIKQEDFPRGAESPLRERWDNPAIQDTWLATYLETVDTHAHSPPRRVCPPSPLSALALQRLRPPSSAAWAEFLNASANGKMERDFALLTLTDGEQRELYEAARIIQNAFRRYKGRRLKEQQDMAAAVIQRCYRKYKQLTWIALKVMWLTVDVVMCSQYIALCVCWCVAHCLTTAVMYPYYLEGLETHTDDRYFLFSLSLRGSFLTKKQDQAARKIMRFLRRCRHRIKELKQTRELERRGLTT
ncbi:calmodulin-binding transcription activator 2 [Haplochromis burtoni]|uniref:calmodulin-binding transcription activator 2 n=1 Tax=Haplochromis burtoni TaxID=8153 RepID=UPI001C2D4D11|nr:calmodulin-binding transcription activator 2 [Haplochromis burtoni]